MTELSKISFSTISYVTEDLNLVIESLKHCLPDNLRNAKFRTQKIQSQFGDKLTIINNEFTGKAAKSIISYLAGLLDSKDKKYIGSMLTNKIDFEDRILHLRLNKFLPLSDKIKLS
ncbi:MAG: RNA-binding domain-containing protein, partial [Candidatus Heimdallarchaeota archaeon]